MKYHSFTPNFVAYLFLALVAVVSVTIFLALVNDEMVSRDIPIDAFFEQYKSSRSK